jgi:hypothetical protein
MFAMQARYRSCRVKALALTLLLLTPIGALASSPEDDYVAARDHYIAELKKLEAPDDLAAHEALKKTDTKDLERRLNAMIGPFSLAGYPAEGVLNPDLCARDTPLGNLDGLAYRGPDRVYEGDAGAALVTTDGLLDRWLLHPTRQYVEGDTRTKIDVPRNAAAAVRTEGFYTVALGHQGPAVARYAAIPIVAPPGAKFATAMLATTDVGPQIPSNPDRLFIALEKGGRVFIVSAPPAPPIKGIAACDAVLATYDDKADAVEKSFNKAKDTKLKEVVKVDKVTSKLRDQGPSCLPFLFQRQV